MSTLKTTNLQHASAASPAIVLASSGSATAQLSSINDGPIAGARNRIINGDMRIAQRGTAAVTVTGGYPVDRFAVAYNISGGAFTAQQSTDAPSGFTYSTQFTVVTAATAGAAEVSSFYSTIEGYNIQDLSFGSSSAKTVTISFWVKSSLTGTYSVSLRNSGASRAYIAEYTINSSNTWEHKIVAIPGSTDGTWLVDNNLGISVAWDLGSGSDRQGTAGSWLSGTNDFASSNNVNWANTSGATFYITGVQLEPGSVATPFERRSYGQELALCQRYFQKSYNVDVAPGTLTRIGGNGMVAHATSSYMGFGFVTFQASMRAAPTVTPYNPDTGLTTNPLRNYSASINGTMAVANIGVFGFSSNADNLSIATNQSAAFQWTASSEL